MSRRHSLRIGIDASRVAVTGRTGTERYSYELLAALARIDRRNDYWLYCNGLPRDLPPLGVNFRLRNLPWPRIWTHLRLGPAACVDRLDTLFIPAHVVPLVHPPRCVVTLHDLGYLAFPQAHTARRRLELHLTTLWSTRAAQRIIAISQATKDDLVRHYGVAPARITVVHHGVTPEFAPVEPQQCTAGAARYGIDGPYLLYVGTIQPRKNLQRLIEAFAQIVSAAEPAQPGLQLVIAGKRGWLSEPIERRAVELGLAGRVRFTGYVADADLPALLSGALAFAFPSLYEGFGLPILEAMACGAPVLTSTSSALPEVAGDAALLVDPRDTAAIARGLLQLATGADLRAELRARGFARATQFSWEHCAQQTLAVLRAAGTSAAAPRAATP